MAKPDVKSLFSFLEPGEQEPKVKVPYRAPAEMPEYEISKGLKPGEVQEVQPTEKSKTPNVDTKALVKKIGNKTKVIEEKHDIKGNIDVPFGPEPTAPPAEPVDTTPLPDFIANPEQDPGMPEAPRPSIEEVVKQQTEGLPHVEQKQVRNAIVMKDQQDTTDRTFASKSTVWDEIWPALVPLAVGALTGSYDEATFGIAADTLDKIQKEKKEWFKLQGKGKTGKGAGTDQMALEQLRQQGRMELEKLRGGTNRQELEGAKAIYKDLLNKNQQGYAGQRESKKLLEQYGYKNLEEARKHISKLEEIDQTQGAVNERQKKLFDNSFETVIDPVSKKPKLMSKSELSAIPFDQRPQTIPKGAGSMRPQYMMSLNKDTGKKSWIAVDPLTQQKIGEFEADVSDTIMPGLDRQQYNSAVKPLVTQYEKKVGDAVDREQQMTFAYEAFLANNSTAALGALIATLRSLGEKGTLTEGDYERLRYGSAISPLMKLHQQLVSAGTNKLPPELLGDIVDLSKRMIGTSARVIDEEHNRYTNMIEHRVGHKKIPREVIHKFLGGTVPDRSYLKKLQFKETGMAKAGELGGKAQAGEAQRSKKAPPKFDIKELEKKMK